MNHWSRVSHFLRNMQSYKGQRERLEMPFKKEDKCVIFAETEVSGEKDK